MKPNICFVCLKTFPKSGTRTGCDFQSKFWKLAKTHLGIETDDGGESVEDSFCGDCGRLVQDVCGLYSELAAVKCRLSYKLGKMGELLQNSKTKVSDKLGQLLIRGLAEQMSFDKAVELDQLRNQLMNKCQLKREISMPDVRVERMRMTPGLSLPLVPPPHHSASQSEFKVEYIKVEREDESIPFSTHQDDDDYDSNLPSPIPPSSPQPSETEEALPEILPKNIQQALDLIPTLNYQGHDLKPKKKYNKKLPDVEPLPKRRKTVAKKSYAEVDEFKDQPSPKKKNSSSEEEDEYVPPEKKKTHSSKRRHRPKDKVKARKITFFSCPLFRIDESGKLFKCSKCDTVLPNNRAVLKAHVVKEHKHCCPHCPSQFTRAYVLKCHIHTIHEKRSKVECSICCRPFLWQKSLKSHFWTHYSNQEKAEAVARGEKPPYTQDKSQIFQCDQCSHTFYQMKALEKHLEEKHGDLEETPKEKKICQLCGAAVRNLQAHTRVKHTAPEDKRFECAFCKKRFAYNHQLQMHKKQVHATDKPFQCSVCGKQFKFVTHLKYHQAIHSDVKPFVCNVCGMGFSWKQGMKKHIAHVHEGIPPPPATRKVCTLCGADVGNLLKHMKHKHSNYEERKFGCTTCDKRFVSQKDLDRHQFAHVTEKPIICSECGMSFKTMYYMRRHHRKIHGGGEMTSQPQKQQHQLEELGQEKQKQDVKLGEEQLQAVVPIPNPHFF